MRNTYAGYLGLQQLLSAQKLQTGSDDELLFIIIHQQHELWFKLAIHELACATGALMAGVSGKDCLIAFKRLSRVSEIQRLLIHSWDVLTTLTPDEFFLFRETVGRDGASGFQSVQYRIFEYRLGLKYTAITMQTPDGERTLSVYRRMAADQLGPACPTGFVPPPDEALAAVTAEWLAEFERAQLILRLSPRLRAMHGD